MKNTEIDAASLGIPSDVCDTLRNEKFGAAIISNCATKLILADSSEPGCAEPSCNKEG